MVDENKKKVAQTKPIPPAKANDLHRTWLRQVQVGGAVLLVGIVTAGLLIKSKKPPQTQPPEILGPRVSTVSAASEQVRMTIEEFGTAEPRVQAPVAPEVSGRVVAVHEQLQAGGLIPAGETLVQIDKADYQLAYDRATAQLAAAKASEQQAVAAIEQASTQLAIEQAEAAVARSQWEATHPGQPADPLVLRQPQIRQAAAAVQAAKAQVASARAAITEAQVAVNQAQLHLDRTRLSLPYDARVLSESVDVGQFVTPGQVVAQVHGLDAMEITVMIDQRDLAWFDPSDSPAEVAAEFAGQWWTRTGRVDRLAGEVDLRSRLVPVVVRVDQPFDTTDGRPPLMPGAFARVNIQGRLLDRVVTIPRHAVHDGGEVWVVREGRLRIVHPKIIRQTATTAYITEGLGPADPVITTLLDAISDGMKVRLAKEDAEADAPIDPDAADGDGLSDAP